MYILYNLDTLSCQETTHNRNQAGTQQPPPRVLQRHFFSGHTRVVTDEVNARDQRRIIGCAELLALTSPPFLSPVAARV